MGGNTSKKLAERCVLLSKDEQKCLAATFRQASKNTDKIREDDLVKMWGPMLDQHLSSFLCNFLFGFGADRKSTVDFQKFAELYVYNVRGTSDERLLVLYHYLCNPYDEKVKLPFARLKEYCVSTTMTFIKMLKNSNSKRAKLWVSKGFRGRNMHIQSLGESLAIQATGEDASYVTAAQLRKWYESDSLLKMLNEYVFRNLYGIAGGKCPGGSGTESGSDGSGGEESSGPSVPRIRLLPKPEGLDTMPDYPAFIDISHIVWLTSHLPAEHRNKWRFVFSSHIHGESFVSMLGRMVDQGATLIIIEDFNGHIFGGFAPTAWTVGPNFQGSEESFLFTLSPKMRQFPASGYNSHYQYLNIYQKSMPNGMIMGGQLDYGGLHISDEFGTGTCAETCSTFKNYQQLSKEKNFKIRSLEIWGVGDKPLSVKDSTESLMSTRSSVLDTHKSEKNLLAMLGKPSVSDGFRGENAVKGAFSTGTQRLGLYWKWRESGNTARDSENHQETNDEITS